MKKIFCRVAAFALSLTLALNLAACGATPAASTTAASSSASSTVSEAVSEAAVSEAAADIAGWPVTLTDHLGRTVTIEQEPQSIVSGYYITTSLVLALGLGERLTGVEAKAETRALYALAPDAAGVADLPSVGSAKNFDLEGCAALHPDLVILPVKLRDAADALEELGVTVLAVNPENQALLNESIDLIAAATGTTARGDSLKAFAQTALDDLKTRLADTESPTVYLAGNSAVLETAGPAMYQNAMMEAAGGRNAAADISDTYWAAVSYEQVLDWNPAFIFLAADADYTVESVLADEALSACDAVQNGQVYQIPAAQEALDSPVPASFLGSVYMASVMHPEAVSADDYAAELTDFYETFYGFTPDETVG